MRDPKPVWPDPVPPALPPHVERDIRKMPVSMYTLMKGYFFLGGIPNNAFISIDVTNECNMRCSHCYFFEQDHPDELDDDAILAKLDEMKRERAIPFLNCAWVGGEPLLRRTLIERARHYFRWNTVVTNGTLPLPKWERTNIYVSIDGPKEIHERIRVKNSYDKIKRNISDSGVPVTLSCAISTYNMNTLEDLVEEWRHVPNVKNWTFDFYTPIEGLKEDDSQWMGFTKRDEIIDRLIALYRKYPDLFAITEETLRLMKSHRSREVTDNCVFLNKSIAFSPLMERKEKCMLGPKADCNRCGCVVPFYLHSLADKPTVIKDTMLKAARQLRIGRFDVVRRVAQL